jgi:hypothetical protein
MESKLTENDIVVEMAYFTNTCVSYDDVGRMTLKDSLCEGE